MRLAPALLMPLAMSLTLAHAQTPSPADIPKPAPVSVGLAGGGEPDVTRFFLASGPTDYTISPDGTQLAWLSSITGQPQVWTAPARGGTPRQLTYGLGVDGVDWTPNADALLYVADKGGDERYGFYTVSPDGMREREVVPRSEAFTFLGRYTSDGKRVIYASTGRDGRTFDLYSAALDGSGVTLVAPGRPGLYPGPVQPKGSLMIAAESRGEDAQDISLIDLRTGAERQLFKPAEPSAYGSFSWLPDGSGFYFTTNEDRQFQALARYDLASRRVQIIEQPAADVISVSLSSDGRYLVWRTDEAGFEVLHARDLKTGRLMRVPPLPRGTARVDFASRAPVLVVLIQGPTTPGEIWCWDLRTGQATQVVAPSTAGLDLARMVEPEVVRFKARDGVPLSGLLYRPRGPAGVRQPTGKLPVFLRLHGGPSAHAKANWKPEVQHLLAQGIAVLDFNYRGSTGAGKDLAHLNDKRLRPNELGDLADAVAWLRAQAWQGGARIAVGGASYGGYLTNAILGAQPDLFSAGVSEVGVADWVRNLEAAAPSLKASDRLEYGDIDDPADRAFFHAISPMRNAAKIKVPLLLQSGANDPRNGVGEHDEFVAAIRAAGGTVRYMRYDGEGHIMKQLANIIDFNRAKAAFLREQLLQP
ncbi:MAG: S9 family peptidase [Burkholderiales bacterium]|nr:MAG: S9 family peptidase [Burkholderiales bacterium]